MDCTKHLSKLVLSYEKSLELKKLGCDIPSQFYWGLIPVGDTIKTQLLTRTVFDGLIATESIGVQLGEGECFAHTAEELSDLLPKKIIFDDTWYSLIIEKYEWYGHEKSFTSGYVDSRGRRLFSAEGYNLTDCLGSLAIERFGLRSEMKTQKPQSPEQCIDKEWRPVRREIKTLISQGYSYRKISKKLGVSLGFISKWNKPKNG